MPRFKLIIEYDGAPFVGWQRQENGLSIQEALEEALAAMTAESATVHGAGRTDAGVHALGQVASFMLQANIPADSLLRAVNRTLPPAIRIVEANVMPHGFHARHSTIAKTYEYRVFRHSICPPFLARYVHACPWPMDVKILQAAAQFFVGEHNFLSFAATDPDLALRKRDPKLALARSLTGSDAGADDRPAAVPGKQGAIRTIYSSLWEQRLTENGELLLYRVRGNGFLHHMVRNLVGTMLDVGRGYTPISAIPAMLAARSRAAAGPTAPAQGLYLHSVEYGGESEFKAGR
jgi:tRNA pseudouridine38-40 synthase